MSSPPSTPSPATRRCPIPLRPFRRTWSWDPASSPPGLASPPPWRAAPTRARHRSPRLAPPFPYSPAGGQHPLASGPTTRLETEEPMRPWIGVSLLAAVTLAPSLAAAQDADALRKELEQMRKQFEGMKNSYEKAIDDLSQRLQKLESAPTPAAVAPAPPVMSQAPTTPPAPGQPSLMELA